MTIFCSMSKCPCIMYKKIKREGYYFGNVPKITKNPRYIAENTE